MANVQVAGFQPRFKGAQTVALVRRRVLTNNTDPIAMYDALDNVSDGNVIAHTTEAGEVFSVMAGPASYISSGQRIERNKLPAATTYTSTGINPANASYVMCVEDTVATQFTASVDEAIALTDIGINYNMVLTVATGDFSLHELDATSRGTTATLGFRVMEFVIGDPTSDPDAADAKVICMVNAGKREPALEPDNGSLGT
jgi:hypothetical protein